MAMMRPARALIPLALSSPLVAAHTCRVSPLVPTFNDRQQSPAFSSAAAAASSPPTVGYRVAAAFAGKHSRFDPRRDRHAYPPASHAHLRTPQGRPRYNSGQDAFFVTGVGNTTGTMAFGVVDGVGGWEQSGVDPAVFAHGLCGYMEARARGVRAGTEDALGPVDVLQAAYDDVMADPGIAAGGSTACVAVGRSDGELEVANLGDSGFVQLRPNAVAFASPAQTHAFNTPLQLSKIPEAARRRARLFGGEPFHDLPADAARTRHRVRPGDVLVLASDGVWDNLSAGDVLGIVSRYMVGFGAWTADGTTKGPGNKGGVEHEGALEPSGELAALTREGGIAVKEGSLQALLAAAVAGEAKVASRDTRRDGPFAREMNLAYPQEKWQGGKVDDICVVVAVAVQDAEDA